jgi:mannan endo-1,4-beta-mannosidase
VLDAHSLQFVGVNAYEIATDWGVNGSCGTMESDSQLDQLFGSLPPNSLVRFWAWQGSAAINIHTHQLDWTPLDRVFATAAAYHQRLIVVLAGQSGACDGGNWKDPAWYEGGFMQVQNASGLTPLSYWDYMQAVVTRYKNSPALGMWEPISEPEASTCPPQFQPSNCGGHQTCPSEVVAEVALRHFFDVVGVEIHALDPDHLVENGMIGSGQCGTSGPDYETVSASPGIDVLSYHDYDGATPIGGDQWNGLALRFKEAASLRKPIIGGEVGLMAGSGVSCASTQLRASQFEAKEKAQLAAGSSGLLAWDWEPNAPTQCAFDTYPGDPLMSVIAEGPLG